MFPDAHELVHEPQATSEVCRFRQVPLQQVCPDAQLFPHVPQEASDVWRFRHTPEQQVCPDAQELVHEPQETSEVCRLRQVPLQQVVPLAQPVPPVQAPDPLQVSPVVHPLLSLQVVPAAFGVKLHAPVAGSQVPVDW